MAKVNTYIWDGKNNDVIKVLQMVLPFSRYEDLGIDSSYMESFGIPLRDGAWLEMSHWQNYDKPTSLFDGLEPEDKDLDIDIVLDGYDLDELECQFE